MAERVIIPALKEYELHAMLCRHSRLFVEQYTDSIPFWRDLLKEYRNEPNVTPTLPEMLRNLRDLRMGRHTFTGEAGLVSSFAFTLAAVYAHLTPKP